MGPVWRTVMIELDADQKTPLYEQLYAALADEIRTGQRAPGDRKSVV